MYTSTPVGYTKAADRPSYISSSGGSSSRRISLPSGYTSAAGVVGPAAANSTADDNSNANSNSSNGTGYATNESTHVVRSPAYHRSASASLSNLVGSRYRLDCMVGKGHFASVYRATDVKTGNAVAVKILGFQYTEDARIEQVILQRLGEADKKGKKKVVKLFDAFSWHTKFCLVMPLLGDPLSRRRFGVHEGHVRRSSLQLLAKQLAEALTFIHGKCALVHTDLKPDNILCDSNNAPGLGHGWTIADFGNSFFHIEGKDGTSLITTRPYRSPEVLTKRGWRHPTDMWSVGCILYEVYVGRALFGVNSGDPAHISLITSKLGAIPGVPYAGLPPPRHTTYLSARFGDDPEFLDLLTGLLEYDPTKRLRAKEMCKHPFTNPGDPDAVPCYPAMFYHASSAVRSASHRQGSLGAAK